VIANAFPKSAIEPVETPTVPFRLLEYCWEQSSQWTLPRRIGMLLTACCDGLSHLRWLCEKETTQCPDSDFSDI
jgi:hypothetical protein